MTNDATRNKPLTDGPWTIGPAPGFVRYIVLGEEGAELLMLYGHDITDGSIRDVIRQAGFGRVLDDLVHEGRVIMEGATVDDLSPLETWTREVRGCRRHGWLPWWVRLNVIRPVDWARWQVFRALWATWWRGKDPLELPRAPGWLKWLGRHWRAFSDCAACEVVDHHRTCSGCVWCNNTPEDKGKPVVLWDWSTPNQAKAGRRDDTNAGRRGYEPVTVISMEE